MSMRILNSSKIGVYHAHQELLSRFVQFQQLLKEYSIFIVFTVIMLFSIPFYRVTLSTEYFTFKEMLRGPNKINSAVHSVMVYEENEVQGEQASEDPMFSSPYFFFDSAIKTFDKLDLALLNNSHYYHLEDRIIKSVPKQMKNDFKKVLFTTFDFAEKYQIDPFWALSIMWVESHFDHSQISPVGAKGLMQIMPNTGRYLATLMKKGSTQDEHHFKRAFFDDVLKTVPAKEFSKNIEKGIFYLKYLMKLFDNDMVLVTVSYNMGPTYVLNRVKSGLPVGTRNQYLDKVKIAYRKLSTQYR